MTRFDHLATEQAGATTVHTAAGLHLTWPLEMHFTWVAAEAVPAAEVVVVSTPRGGEACCFRTRTAAAGHIGPVGVDPCRTAGLAAVGTPPRTSSAVEGTVADMVQVAASRRRCCSRSTLEMHQHLPLQEPAAWTQDSNRKAREQEQGPAEACWGLLGLEFQLLDM